MNNLTATDVAQTLSLQRRDSDILMSWNVVELAFESSQKSVGHR